MCNFQKNDEKTMCTVTLIATPEIRNGFILTSNRDEAVGRKTLTPDWELYKGVNLFFPKDAVAGGTWIGVSERLRTVCLMNGGFQNHKRKDSYRKSRGVVVKDFLAAEDLELTIMDYNCEDIEPFTVILVDWHKELLFLEFVWDGNEKHIKNLPQTEHIWSSSPLYSEEMKALRQQWFTEFQNEGDINPEKLLKFHHTGGIGDKKVDLIIDRGFLKTQSITQVDNCHFETRFWYKDLNQSVVFEKKIKF
ncbi:NRDE family protein [Salegentibacter sp. F188]|uniref:NRDE family protein n=1 Tax=Autumnicola patrickiae TaxID=3075591 RepID=A0ABU3E518_9FLAO|nr:NRDE family protein [Salegentibacter sp. F188]MDT0691037.1 NRDE family protein [Salegentibacter sp. F188]